ncbi:cysteine proteinase [Aspergillus affinis]|uniref:cysteine proteinase n=1 Tax=Aspergillus affinis TaxID=1070780 RepID=UPI0022FE633E|nr:cysteine proteinase [Aspergillus affinis]KAI9041530.1 cysteine proteinase [Aspergillus affinis]
MDSSNNQEDQRTITSRNVLPSWSADYHGLTPLRGFANSSVLCYRNSALCVILHSPLLINWMASHYEEHLTDRCVICLLHRLVVSFWKGDSSGEDKDAVLEQFWTRIREYGCTWSKQSPEEQQDVREFIESIFNQMILDSDGMEPFDLAELLKIKSSLSLKCKACSKVMTPSDQVWFCSPRDGPNLREEEAPIEIGHLIKRRYSDSTENFGCEQCKTETGHARSEDVTEIPEILLICLNRMDDDKMKSFWNVSLSDQMVLPDSLRGCLADKDDIKYELYVIIFHDGDSIKSGHYTAAVRAPTGKWMLMNDDAEARPMQSLETLMNMGEGNTKHSATAYVLVYRRLPLGGESAPAEGQTAPTLAKGESAAVGDNSKQEQAQGDASGPSEDVLDQTQAMPLEEPSPTDPAVDPAVLVPDLEIAPSSPSPVGSRASRPGSPVRPGVTMDGTISLDGREVEWKIQQQLTMPSDAGPLIKVKPRAKVQRANIRLTLTSGEEVLEGEVTISLKPAVSKSRPQKPAKTPKTMNTKAKKATDKAGQKKAKATTSSKQAKPEGVKKGTKAGKTAKSNTKTKATTKITTTKATTTATRAGQTKKPSKKAKGTR